MRRGPSNALGSMRDISMIDLRDVDPGTRADLCLRFHEQVYRAAFPDPDVAETPEVWLPLLEGTGPGGHVLHVVLAVGPSGGPTDVDTPAILGGAVIEFFPRSEVTLLSYLCIATGLRGRGLGHAFIRRIRAVGSAHSSSADPLVVCEARSADASPDGSEARHDRLGRIRVLNSLGFREVMSPYRQPPLAPGRPWVDGMMLLAHSPDGDPAVDRPRLELFLDEYRRSLGVPADPDPVPHP